MTCGRWLPSPSLGSLTAQLIFVTALADFVRAALRCRRRLNRPVHEDALDHLRRELAAGEWLFRRGDVGDSAYLIETGAINIVADDSTQNRDRLIARLG